MKRSNLDPATKADIVRFVKLLIDEALDHEFDRGDFEEEMVLESRIRETVGERLKSMVESGQLTSRTVRLPDGYRCIAYRKKPNS